ncbi:ribose-binding protein [Chthonomonas calidirosea]|uniref:sugar ABC transporter substrate-binding protein n=1 Tax=Chthonomonas calidirosea TaxID=454171 RepID=UPI0006DD4BD1|nr:sugar ABC transporter substrate-binding protein [Chthonomonas calidirosea]CEK13517.1 ribose-binding protein [Chthonomonas calidirosea]
MNRSFAEGKPLRVKRDVIARRTAFQRGLMIGLLFFALAGCSSNPSGSGGATSSRQGGNGALSQRVIAVVSPAKTSPFHVTLAAAAAEEAKRLGLPPIIDQAPSSESDYTGQVALVQDIIQRHPAAISVCGINPQALVNIIKNCNRAHIPIFVHNQISPVEGGGQVVSYIGYDEYEGGRKCGEEAAELLKQKYGAYRGNVAILDGEPGDHTNLRAGGFKDALKKYPDIHIVAEQNGHWLRADGTAITRDWLQRFPNLDLVFGCSDEMALGAAKAARDAGRQLLTIGIDGNRPSLEAIRDGKYTACLATQPDLIGKAVIDTINDYLSGKKVPPVVKTPCVIVTKANVAQFLK